MKKFLLITLMACITGFVHGQTIYYWVGSAPSANQNINTGANWNTAINGSGSSRPSSTGASDILIFDGSNLGGSTPITGPVTINAAGGLTAAQMKFVNNANISLVRPTSGTSSYTLAGEVGDDLTIEAGSSLNLVSNSGSLRFIMGPTISARVAGNLTINMSQQMRFENTTAGTPGSFVFESGSSFHTNLTGSGSYAFGSATQSSEKWVVFEPGAHLYFEGGNSPMGNNSGYSAIEFMPGSFWHHRGANTGAGSYFNRKSFANIIVENSAALTSDGPIYHIENLTIGSGSNFTTHVSGQTVITGNVLVDGDLLSDPASTNQIVLAGAAGQTISGGGTISIGGLLVADNANVDLQKSISLYDEAKVLGKIDFNNNQLTGTGAFVVEGPQPVLTGSAELTMGSRLLKGNTMYVNSNIGMSISGPGIPANASIVSLSVTLDTVFISHPVTVSGTGVSVSGEGNGATLENNNTSGYEPSMGSVVTSGNHTFDDEINYIINGATTWPFGISTAGSATQINAGFLEVNANVSLNRNIRLTNYLTINGKLTVPPGFELHITPGAIVNGSVGASSYIATGADLVTGNQGVVRFEGISTSTLIPIGSDNYYLPITINPTTTSEFTVSAFQGITENGAVNGTPLSPTQKLTVLDAVWNIARVNGTGNADIQFGWDAALEGATFITLPGTDIGAISNNGTTWSVPLGTGDNTANTASANVSTFSAFSVGAVPQVDPFVFNPLPGKTYGDADFNGGATSLNTTQPIVYTSSNPLVATIVGGDIHITGAGTTDITASQATDGVYPAISITHPLVVATAALTITADDKTKFQGLANPPLTVTYTGLVLGEDESDLLTPPVISTTAVTGSDPGTYPITVSGATSGNYTITFVNGTLTILPKQTQTITFNELPVKTYGNADFAIGASSTNNTIPVVVTSSDPSVATIIGNTIHIVGAGTSTITASQAGNDGYFPAMDVARQLVVNKANLTIRVRDTSRVEGEVNPTYTITYTGFVLGESATNLLTPVSISTDANISSTPGSYPLTIVGGTSNNYNVTYLNGRLLVLPLAGTEIPYLNAYMSNSSTLTVRVFYPEPILADIYLFDMNGRLMLKKNIFLPEGFISNNIAVDKLSAGIYALVIKGNGVDLKKQIIIAK